VQVSFIDDGSMRLLVRIETESVRRDGTNTVDTRRPKQICIYRYGTRAGCVGTVRRVHGGDERVSVAARGSLLTDNAHRDSVIGVAIAGGGVVRILDWNKRQRHEIVSGLLEPVLPDWEVTEVPPVNLLYPPSVRRIPRVRVFIDFVTQLFRDIEMQREVRAPATPMPQWRKTRHTRASATIARGR
jgi:LysR family transcriptional regulator, regulator for bpeEF and oprC